MSTLNRWLFSLTVDAILFALFYAWKFDGAEWAGNVLLFFLWFSSVCLVLAMFLPLPRTVDRRIRSLGYFNLFTSALMVAALAAFGHFTLAAFYACGVIGCISRRSQFDDAGAPINKKSVQGKP